MKINVARSLSLLPVLILGIGVGVAPATLHAAPMAQNLADIWNLALARDPLYAASSHARDAGIELLPQARARLLPNINANAGGELNNTRRRRTLSHSNTSRKADWTLSLSQPLFNLSAWQNYQGAQFSAQLAEVGYTLAYQNLLLRVTQAYFDILKSQDALRALRAQIAAVKTQLKAATHGFELGSTTVTDMHEAQARLDLLQASEYEAVNLLQVRNDALATLIAEPPGALAELASDALLPAPEPNRLQEWTIQAESTNLAVLQSQLTAHIIEKKRDAAKSEYLPRVDLQAQTGSASDRGIYGNVANTGPRSIDTRVGISLSIPLYNGGERASVVREQSSRLQQARFEFEAAKRTARQQAQQYFSGVTSGLARIQALEAAERSSQAALHANELAYEVGVRINIDVLNAQQQLYETQRLLSQARYDTLMHSMRLKASSGTLTEQDLLAINTLLIEPSHANDVQ